jgi:[ribosomal protein S5]-alanine N-acetyltransferase
MSATTMKTPFLIGQKIYLRPIEREDAPAIGQFVNDPEVRATLQMFTPKTQQQEREFIEGMGAGRSNTDIVLGIALKEDDRLIGTTGFHQIDWKNQRASYGIAIGAKDCWNKGCGTETTRLMVKYAFEELALNRVYLTVYDFNTRGIRAYENAGFRREGLLRQDIFKAGKFWDVWLMGILKEDYDQRQPTKS